MRHRWGKKSELNLRENVIKSAGLVGEDGQKLNSQAESEDGQNIWLESGRAEASSQFLLFLYHTQTCAHVRAQASWGNAIFHLQRCRAGRELHSNGAFAEGGEAAILDLEHQI